MRTVVVGAGPIGLYSGIMLARAGHDVTIVDRDAGPGDTTGAWERKGVMQFMHPHYFRALVGMVFKETAPDLWDAVLAAGAVPARPDGMPEFLVNLQCRRWVFERAIRTVAAVEPRLHLRRGHVERVEQRGGRVSGVVVDGSTVDAELVIDASGRNGKLADELRAPAEGGSCGLAYVSRMYKARPGVEALPANSLPSGELHDGYQVILFPQDAGTLSALIIRRADDHELAVTRHVGAYEAAVATMPLFREWTDQERFEPITDVIVGGHLTNTYRGQLDEHGAPALPGMYWVGDAMCTTNPAAGRGISLGLRQVATLVSMIAEDGTDPASTSLRFHDWCAENIEPWFHDHVYWDATLLRRLAGEDIDVEARIPSDVICAAATDVDPSMMSAAGPYMAMMALPSALTPFEERTREILRTGWRPPTPAGPTRDEVLDAMQAVSAAR